MNKISYIIFRVDFSAKIGTGHIRRCLTLAGKFKKSKIIFFSRNYKSSDFSILENSNFQCYKLNELSEDSIDFKNTSSWLNIDPQNDVDEISDYLVKNKINPNLLIIDHYGIDSKWQSIFKKKFSSKILIIDDLANRKHIVDYLLDTSISRTFNDYKELIPNHTKCFLGSSYALIKDNIINLKKNSNKQNSKFKDILLFLSGTDPYNLTTKVIKAIDENDNILDRWNRLIIVIGNKYDDKINLKKIVNNNKKLFLYINPYNFDSLLSDCSLLISGGGVILYEKIFLGIPSLNISMAENQNKSLEYFNKINCLSLIGNLDDTKASINVLINKLENYDESIYINQLKTMNKIDVGSKITEIINLEDL